MSEGRLAVLGGVAAFSQPLPVGQLYFPDWADYEAAMRGIFERQYYTNQGPLTQQLEESLQQRLGVRHVICVANATIGLLMAADALGIQGKVITPAYSFVATSQSLTWSGLEPLFCDVDERSHQLSPLRVAELISEKDVGAILAVNLWGDVCDHQALAQLAKKQGIPLYYDSAHAFGCVSQGRHVGAIGTLEVFSFHATKVLSAAEGGCVCTNDDELAARLRNIRSSYGAGRPVSVKRTSNGRMSEAQAAIALLSLDAFPRIVERNRQIFAAYERGLADLPGLRLVKPNSVDETNYQYVVCEVDAQVFGLSRDQLQSVLRAENILARRYFFPGIHRSPPYAEAYPDVAGRLPITEALCSQVLQLPIGALVDPSAAERIAALVREAHVRAGAVRAALEGQV